MRYSVLLPTRNGARLLTTCLKSVLDQPYQDMELIVSDNASDDGTAELLDRYRGDPRLTVLRQDEFLSVTDNWNRALRHSRGDYITLLGDDDVMLANFFERADALLEQHDAPDLLTYNAYAYAFPGMGGALQSYYADPFYEVDSEIPRGQPVSVELRRQLVSDLFRFMFRMHLNLQGALIGRRSMGRLNAGLFQPPFPDFYALNALLLTVDTWVHTDDRLMVVGISPKSFGRMLHSERERVRGRDYLQISTEFAGQLPGSELVNGTYLTLMALERDYPAELAGVRIDRGAYVRQQLLAWYREVRAGAVDARTAVARLALLGWRDAGALLLAAVPRLFSTAIWKQLRLGRRDRVEQLRPGMRPLPEVKDIAQFADWVAARHTGRDW